MDGVEVTEAEREADGRLTVWARITLPATCPGCRTVSERVHQYVTVTPRDVRACGQDTDFFLVKRRMECAEKGCPAETFTESVPQLPLRCTITRRLLEHAGGEVADRGITPAEAGRDAGISWPSAHAAFAARADETLDGEPSPVAHLGIDEHRRGRPRWRQGKAGTRAADLPVTRELPGLIRDCDAKLARNEHAAALLTLTSSPLPAPQTWRQAREYRQLCTTTASRVAELCDGDRTKLARWTTDSAALFRTHSDQAGTVIKAEAARVAQELNPGAAAVRDADAMVTREAAMLGRKS